MRVRLATLVVGLWIGMSVAMWFVAAGNLSSIDRILEPGYRPELSEHVAPRTLAEERPIVRFVAVDLNRLYFLGWARLQILFMVVLLAVVMTGPTGRTIRSLTIGGVIITGLNSLWLTPALTRLGQPLDFLSRPVPPAWAETHASFMRLHGLYMGLDLVKMILLAILVVVLLRDRSVGSEG